MSSLHPPLHLHNPELRYRLRLRLRHIKFEPLVLLRNEAHEVLRVRVRSSMDEAEVVLLVHEAVHQQTLHHRHQMPEPTFALQVCEELLQLPAMLLLLLLLLLTPLPQQPLLLHRMQQCS
jgi:hypothetical protein